jgi:hypothetical protein
MARNISVPLARHLLQAVHAGGGLFGHADDLRALAAVPGAVDGQLGLDGGEQLALFLAARVGDDRGVLLGTLAQVHQQRGVAAVVQDHVRAFAFGTLGAELEDAVRVVPVVLQRSRPCRRTPACPFHQRGGGVVLRAEDVAAGPAHFGAQRLQRLHQHGGLDGHVQAAGDARALQRLLAAYSRRISISAGISCSAMVISLRPQAASDRSATAYWSCGGLENGVHGRAPGGDGQPARTTNGGGQKSSPTKAFVQVSAVARGLFRAWPHGWGLQRSSESARILATVHAPCA